MLRSAGHLSLSLRERGRVRGERASFFLCHSRRMTGSRVTPAAGFHIAPLMRRSKAADSRASRMTERGVRRVRGKTGPGVTLSYFRGCVCCPFVEDEEFGVFGEGRSPSIVFSSFSIRPFSAAFSLESASSLLASATTTGASASDIF